MTLPDVTMHLVSGLVGIIAGVWASRALRSASLKPHIAITAALVVLGAALGVGLATQRHPVFVLLACLLLTTVALPLSAIDAVTHTLPDRIVLPAAAGVAVLLTLAATRVGDVDLLERELESGLVVFAAFTAVALAAPGHLGFGDCKAAALCALPLGYLGWNRVLLGIALAFLLAACYVAGRRAVRPADRTKTTAFGMFLFAGTFAMLLIP
jgi:leader peptidase (prepilin peptidase)/N-methyltransferase